jgi:YebC/PmpR family DNA-binding regulatory protein
MSGHSKWSTIKRKKGANDAQRAKEFTKIARLITFAAQSGGGDPAMNPALGLAMDKAKAINMPNDNIDRAIKRGTGEGGNSARLEEISYEGYAPCNVALIIDATTDNRNRTVSDLRSFVEKAGGRLTEGGAVSWQFTTVGQILLEFETEEEKIARENVKWSEKDKLDKPKLNKSQAEDLELELYDQDGVKDVSVDENGMIITTEYASLNNIKIFIDSKGYKITDASLVKVSANTVELSSEDQERVEKFIEAVEELDDIQRVWTNIA